MYHFTTGKNNDTCIVSVYYRGFYSNIYDQYFDSLINSHISFAEYNNMDYHCFNSDLIAELGLTPDFAHGCVGMMKWYTAWYCLHVLGYSDVMVVDIDTLFMQNELLPQHIVDSKLAASQPYYWHFTDAAWVLYALYRDGASIEHIDRLQKWYNTGTFKVSKELDFKPYLDSYTNTIRDAHIETTGLLANTPHTGWYKRRIMAPYDEGFLQYFIALSGNTLDIFPYTYNAGTLDDTVLFHFTDKSLMDKHCTKGNTLLNHGEV